MNVSIRLQISLFALLNFVGVGSMRAASSGSSDEPCPCPLPTETTLDFRGDMCVSGSYNVELNGVVAFSTQGEKCEFIETETGTTTLEFNQTYTISATLDHGEEICTYHYYLELTGPGELFVDGESYGNMANINQETAEIEIRPIEVPGGTPGEGGFQNSSGGGSGGGSGEASARVSGGSSSWRSGKRWYAELGSKENGFSAGGILLDMSKIDRSSFHPESLELKLLCDDADVIHDASDTIRQIKTPEGLVDIVIIGEEAYELSFYKNEDVGSKIGDLYTATGEPYHSWSFENPDVGTGAYNSMRITEKRGAFVSFNEVTKTDAGDEWTFSYGDGLKVETVDQTQDATTGVVTKTTTISGTAGNIVSKVTEKRKNFPWNTGNKTSIMERIEDPDGEAHTTTTTYYEDRSLSSSYGKIKSQTYPDGSWVKYEYVPVTGLRYREYRPWKSAPATPEEATDTNCHLTSYTYGKLYGSPTTAEYKLKEKTTTILGIQTESIAHSYIGSEVNGQPIITQTTVRFTNVSESLTTRTARYTKKADEPYKDELLYVQKPDGTMTTYAYALGTYNPADHSFTEGSGTDRRTLATHGTREAPEGIPLMSTCTTSIHTKDGRVYHDTQVLNASGRYERINWKTFSYDSIGRLLTETENGHLVQQNTWRDGLLQKMTDAYGTETTYTYDELGRRETMTKLSAPDRSNLVTTYTYDAVGRLLSTGISSGGLSLATSMSYDLLGRRITQTGTGGLITTYSYDATGRIKTETRPDSQTRITAYHLDGQLMHLEGTGVVHQYYDYTIETNGYRTTTVYTGSHDDTSPRWRMVEVDWMGRSTTDSRPSYRGALQVMRYHYNSWGQLERLERNGLSDILYEYDALGRKSAEGLDLDGDDGVLTPLSTDRIVRTDTRYSKENGIWYAVIKTSSYLVDDSSAADDLMTLKQQLTGLPVGATTADPTILSRSIQVSADGSETITTQKVVPATQTVTSRVEHPDSAFDAVETIVHGLTITSTSHTHAEPTSYTYDALERPYIVDTPSNGSLTMSYDPVTGQLLSQTDELGHATTFSYHPQSHLGAGQQSTITDAHGKIAYISYDAYGNIHRQWGETDYPKEYIYDTYSQLIQLNTWRSGDFTTATFPVGETPDTTTWNYHAATGLLANKTYADGKGTTYSYYDNSLLHTRDWQRGVTTTYLYDGAGQLSETSYSDSTPRISYSYDRAGRLSQVDDAVGTTVMRHHSNNQLASVYYQSGSMPELLLSASTDNGRLAGLSVTHQPTDATWYNASYQYDAALGGQLHQASLTDSMAGEAHTVTYNYQTEALGSSTGLGRPTQKTYNNGTADRLHTSYQYDILGRTTAITSNIPSLTHALSTRYTYDALGRRIQLQDQDHTAWHITYNSRSEVQAAVQKDANHVPIPGRSFNYRYDNLGNRLTYDDASGSGPFSHTTNELNQYTSRQTPDKKWITGTADNTAYVLINDERASRSGPANTDFSWLLDLNNHVSASYETVTTEVNLPASGERGETLVTREDGYVLAPPVNQTLSYDADGNLLSDGLWTYTWNGENRLIAIESNPSLPAVARKKLAFIYDYMGRRIQKQSYDHDGVAYTLAHSTRFLYHGWNLIAEIDLDDRLKKTYLWGTDLSGTMQGAGGVGGLLVSTTAGGSAHYCLSDANGNVTQLIDSSDGSLAAAYAYSPFGQLLESTGPAAEQNPFKFSTRYQDLETNLYYYGFRYYDAELGRWSSRDPIGERGGINLYGMVNNNPISYWDYLGLAGGPWQLPPGMGPTGAIHDQAALNEWFKKEKERQNGSVGNNSANHQDMLGSLPSANYRPMKNQEWMGFLAIIWHAFVQFPDGSTDSNVGPEDGYQSGHTTTVAGQRVDEGKMTVDGKKICCKKATDEQITACVKKTFGWCDFETETCGAQITEAFTKCCMEDPTPWWLYYPDNFPF